MKVSVALLLLTVGAVKVGLAAFVLLSVTVVAGGLGPGVGEGLVLGVRCSRCRRGSPARRSPRSGPSPAFAVGAVFAPEVTVTVTVSVSDEMPSLTVSVKVNSALAARSDGAVKVALVGVLAPVSATSGEPPVWRQA